MVSMSYYRSHGQCMSNNLITAIYINERESDLNPRHNWHRKIREKQDRNYRRLLPLIRYCKGKSNKFIKWENWECFSELTIITESVRWVPGRQTLFHFISMSIWSYRNIYIYMNIFLSLIFKVYRIGHFFLVVHLILLSLPHFLGAQQGKQISTSKAYFFLQCLCLLVIFFSLES